MVACMIVFVDLLLWLRGFGFVGLVGLAVGLLDCVVVFVGWNRAGWLL